MKTLFLILLSSFSLNSFLVAEEGSDKRREFNMDDFKQKMMDRQADRVREKFEIESDEEWEVIKEKLMVVIQHNMDKMMSRGRGMMRGMRGMRGGRNRGGRGGESSQRESKAKSEVKKMLGGPSEMDALTKALEGDSDEAVQKSLQALRNSRKAKAQELKKAQDEFRELLTVKQEAHAVMMGLLD